MSTSLYLCCSYEAGECRDHQIGEAVNLIDAEAIVAVAAKDIAAFYDECRLNPNTSIVGTVADDEWRIHHYEIDGFSIHHRYRWYRWDVRLGLQHSALNPDMPGVVDDWVVIK